MFGYIYVNRKELSEEDRKDYQSYYCGLCQALRKSSGVKGQVLLNYDMTFLIILLSGLYELENKEEEFFCPLHPGKKKIAYINEVTQYASDMNVLLSYHNLLDDWQDEKNYPKHVMSMMLKKDYARISRKYPRQVEAVEAYMRFYMGKFIYLMDAYEDLEKDLRKKEYNPFESMVKNSPQDFETLSKLILTSMMSECSKSFERLPILQHASIIRNILYSGVWSKYEYVQAKKKKRRKSQ